MKNEMRALSIGQPWAELILRRRKTIEIRRWKVAYRGSLLIHASKRLDRVAAETLGVAEDEMTRGAFGGIATLKEIRPFTKKDARLLKAKRAGTGECPRDHHAWVLRNVRRIKPIPFKGQTNLMRVPNGIVRKIERQVASESRAESKR